MRLICTCKECGAEIAISGCCDSREEVKNYLGESFLLTCNKCHTTTNYLCYEVKAALNSYFFAIAPILTLFIPITLFVSVRYDAYPILILLPIFAVGYVHYDNREYKRIKLFNELVTIYDNNTICPIVDDCDINVAWFRNTIMPKFEELNFTYFNDDFSKIEFDGMFCQINHHIGRVYFFEDESIYLDIFDIRISDPLFAIRLEKEVPCKEKKLVFEKFIGILQEAADSNKNESL